MTDPPSYPGTRENAGAEPASERAAGGSRRRALLIWLMVIVLFLTVLILHLTGTVGANMNG